MTFHCVKMGPAMALKVEGRLDAASAPEFERECAKWIAQGETILIVDMSGLEYISSAGLRGVLTVGKTLKGRGGRVLLCGAQGIVKEVFEVSGFASIFPFFEDLDAAVAGL